MLLNVYREWLKVKRGRQNSKAWARAHGVEEQVDHNFIATRGLDWGLDWDLIGDLLGLDWGLNSYNLCISACMRSQS